MRKRIAADVGKNAKKTRETMQQRRSCQFASKRSIQPGTRIGIEIGHRHGPGLQRRYPPSPTVYILDVKRSESSRHGPDLPFMEALPSRYLNTSGENFPHPSGGNSRRVSRGRRSDRNPSTMETSPTWSTRSGSPHPDPLQGIFNAHLPVVDLPNKPFPTRRSETNPSAVSGTCTVSPSWSRKTGASIHHVKCIAAGKTLPIGRVRNLPGVITSGDGSTIVTSRYRAIGSSAPSPATTKHGRTSGHGSDF